jgi:transcriptional regulator with XRE-family HTH domain
MLRNIRRLRDERAISQQKLADAIGMSQQSINSYENHNVEPDIMTLTRIADYFETSVDYVVAHTDIRRKIEEVGEYALNAREAALVDGYRALPASSRRVIDALIADMLKNDR